MSLGYRSLSRRPLRTLMPLALAAFAVASGAAAGEDAMPAAMTGMVVDPDGAPVAGARVWTEDIDRQAVESRTDAEGRFRLGPLTPACRAGKDVYVDADGFARQYAWGGALSRFPGEDHDLGTIRLDRPRSFAGQVLDVDGSPLAGVAVMGSYHLGLRLFRGDRGWAAETDSEGRFRTPPLPVGFVGASVQVPGRRTGLTSTRVAPGDTEGEFEPIRLELDEPVVGVVRDEDGEPISGATVTTFGGYEPVETDASGAFTIRGLPPHRPYFPIGIRKDGYVSIINRPTYPSEGGFSWYEEGPDGEHVRVGPFADLTVTMKRTSWIEGRVIDAETGDPVRLSSVVLCFFDRTPDGEVVLSGCRNPEFSQPGPGHFRLSYATPTEYHLTLSAEGYHDAEAFTPKVDTLRPIEGIRVEMTRKADTPPAVVPTQQLVGVATRNGRPITTGWAALARVRGTTNLANAYTQRGRMVAGELSVFHGVPTRDGAFELDVPYQDDRWFVLVEEPGHAPTVVGPVLVALGERKRLDVTCVEGGSIAGRVSDVPEADRGSLWVVAFSDVGTRAEARVEADGTFRLPDLPSGRYGLKLGHDAFEDAEVPPARLDRPREDFERLADPWKRAEVVTVGPGAIVADVVLPAPETPDRLDPDLGTTAALP